MKNRILLLLVFVHLVFVSIPAQEYLIHAKPVKAKTWKYINIKGDVVINCDYPVTFSFSDCGLGVAFDPKKKTYIIFNSKGEEIPAQVDKFILKNFMGRGAVGYKDGRLLVMKDKKWGYLDTKGQIAVDLKYDYLSIFSDGYGIGLIKKDFFIVDGNGNETPVDKDVVVVKHFTEGLSPYSARNRRQGFIDTTGKIVIPAMCSTVGYFSNGLAWARGARGLFGYLNTKGEWAIPAQFRVVKDFDVKSGMARVEKNSVMGYVNEAGEFKVFTISDVTDDFSEGLARGRALGKFGFYNNKGEWVIKPKFENVGHFNNGYAAAREKGLWGVIDTTGNWVIQPTFERIKEVVKIK